MTSAGEMGLPLAAVHTLSVEMCSAVVVWGIGMDNNGHKNKNGNKNKNRKLEAKPTPHQRKRKSGTRRGKGEMEMEMDWTGLEGEMKWQNSPLHPSLQRSSVITIIIIIILYS